MGINVLFLLQQIRIFNDKNEYMKSKLAISNFILYKMYENYLKHYGKKYNLNFLNSLIIIWTLSKNILSMLQFF